MSLITSKEPTISNKKLILTFTGIKKPDKFEIDVQAGQFLLNKCMVLALMALCWIQSDFKFQRMFDGVDSAGEAPGKRVFMYKTLICACFELVAS